MQAKHRESLRKHRLELCQGMDNHSKSVVTQLVDRKIMTNTDEQIIIREVSSVKQNEKILDTLTKRGPKAFHTFIEILNDMGLNQLTTLLLEDDEKQTVNDTPDGRPALDEKQKTTDSSSISPVDKLAKLDDDIDTVDMPPQEQEDGRFGGIGGKKKTDMPSKMDTAETPMDICFNPEDCYSMKRSPRGRFLLINNKDFLPESGMAPYTRNGTDVDAQCMKELFEELGFVVEYHRNITVYEIRKAFKKMATSDYSQYSAFACCVLSHGQEGILYGTDGTVDIKELTAFFRGKNLAGKPKMFFFQACQGSEYMDGVERDSSMEDETDGPPEYGNEISLPTEADFLYAYSTVPGYYSWRNSVKGSWFIQAIVEVFRKYAHKMDVVRMLTRVNQIVSTKKSQTGQRPSHHKRQISSVITQLRKEIYLFPPHGPLKEMKADY